MKDKIKILFLSNNENANRLYDWLTDECDIRLCREKLDITIVKEYAPDLIISYNYKYMIRADVIEYMQGNVINLHISYLPWNRGSNPNFWSFVENTPKGVTIHLINEKLDEGAILYQKELEFDVTEETFETSYEKLNQEITELFIRNWDEIREKSYVVKKQSVGGSYHNMQDFLNITQKCPIDWKENIGVYLERLDRENN